MTNHRDLLARLIAPLMVLTGFRSRRTAMISAQRRGYIFHVNVVRANVGRACKAATGPDALRTRPSPLTLTSTLGY